MQIKGRFKISQFKNDVRAAAEKIDGKIFYQCTMRCYTPEKPTNSMMCRLTAIGYLVKLNLLEQLKQAEDESLVAFCYFKLERKFA